MFGYSQEEIKGNKVVIKPRDIEKLDLDTMCELEEILNDISASLQQGAVKG